MKQSRPNCAATLDVKRDQKRRGRHLGGKRPFGFHIEADGSLTEHEGEQAAIRKEVSRGPVRVVPK